MRWQSLQWRHDGRDGVPDNLPNDCLLNRLFRCRSKKTSKLRVTGLCAGNSPATVEFPAQRASNAENVSICDVIMMYKVHGDVYVMRSFDCPLAWCAYWTKTLSYQRYGNQVSHSIISCHLDFTSLQTRMICQFTYVNTIKVKQTWPSQDPW